MKTTTINGQEVEIWCAYSIPAGHGHKKIFVELVRMQSYKKFSATTNNMPAYDEATELEGSAQEEALYNIIASEIEDQVIEWLDTL
ncbi:MAG: hypothetical protein U1D64_05180 [Bacteroidales bacterium]|nr:hypothetical protein [Bacteroidales bacterium]